MNYIKQLNDFKPANEQEEQDKKVILDYIEKYQHNVLLRENYVAHITSSGFIMNKDLTKALMVHHNILNKWAWTGGHADGDEGLLRVAIKEAKEETGIVDVAPISDEIMSIDILPVPAHRKNGVYINTHLHLSIAYVLVANENEETTIKEDENSGVSWIPVEEFTKDNFNDYDTYLYGKLIKRAKDKAKNGDGGTFRLSPS